jgi:hypothetical protein
MYPVGFEADYQEEHNRLTTFFRLILAIPGMIVASLWGIAAWIAAIIAWFAIVFTGRYPEGLYKFNQGYLRMSGRWTAYALLLTDKFAPLSGSTDPDYPIRIGVAEPLPQYNRAKTGFRFILAIPVFILSYVWVLIAEVVAFVAWFAILFTGKLPRGMSKLIRSGVAYSLRSNAYGYLLMTETYPPFMEEDGAPQLPEGGGPALAAPSAEPQQEQV